MSVLKVRLDQFNDSDDLQSSGVIAHVYSLPARQSRSTRHLDHRGLTIPAGIGDVFLRLDVGPGRYLVEAILPSGQSVSEEVLISSDDEEQEVRLVGPPSRHEWLGWHNFVGNRSASLMHDFEHAKTLVRPDLHLIREPPSWIALRHRETTHISSGIISWSPLAELIEATPEEATGRLRDRLKQLASVGEPAQAREVRPARSDQYQSAIQFGSAGEIPWRDEQRRQGIDYRSQDINRFSLSITSDLVRPEIAILPIPWRQVDSVGEAIVDLVLTHADPEESADFRGVEHLSSVTVRDRVVGSLLGYLASGDLPNAAVLVDRAKMLLFEKNINPLAAAAGAYILLVTDTSNEHRPWHYWVENLMNWFPWIPDGAVLYGWAKLSCRETDSDDAAAREAFLTAYRRGIPFYSTGVRRLLDGLTILADEAGSSGRNDREIWEALARVHFVARQVNMQQPFTSIRLGANIPMSTCGPFAQAVALRGSRSEGGVSTSSRSPTDEVEPA